MNRGRHRLDGIRRWLKSPFARPFHGPDVQPEPVAAEPLAVSWASCRPRTERNEQEMRISLRLPAERPGDVRVTQHKHCLSVAIAGVGVEPGADSGLRRTIPIPAGAPWELVGQSVRDDLLVVQLKRTGAAVDTPADRYAPHRGKPVR